MYTLIQGTYYVVGMSPDADSIKFKANNPDLWEHLKKDNPAAFDKALKKEEGAVTIRLQAIDALETHYTPPRPRPPKGLSAKAKKVKAPSSGNHRQPQQLGDDSTSVLLEFMGVTDVKWRKWGRNSWIDHAIVNGREVDDKFADAIPGYIIANDIERNGRPLGWVFAGKPPIKDGTQLDKKEVGDLVAQSANYHLLARGIVYPFFYMDLPAAIRLPLMFASKKAQDNADQEDVWIHDHTTDGVTVPSLQNLYDDTVVYPYLFRRIVRHWYSNRMTRFWQHLEDGYDTELSAEDELDLSLDGFFENSDPWIFVSSEQDFLRLSDVLEVGSQSLKLRVFPYDIVFLS